MKHPQITEEHASDIWFEAVSSCSATSKSDFISKLKKEGFIKKSPVEEIKERYNKWNIPVADRSVSSEHISMSGLINDMYKVILDLEKQIEEMKK